MTEQERYWKELNEDYYTIMCKKNQDYSPANIVYSGVPGVLIRIWDKTCRLFSLFNVQIPNYLVIFDARKTELKEEIRDVLSGKVKPRNMFNSTAQNIQFTIDELIDKKFVHIEKECQVDFSKFKELDPQNESILDAFKDLEIYTRIGHLRYLGKWGR